jgi:hypothetical protein
MLDKSYVKAVQVGNTTLVWAKHGTGITIVQTRLSLKKEKDRDYRIHLEDNDCEGRGEDFYLAFEDLQNQLFDRNITLCCCGNCRFFQLTGLSRQMSSGTAGYCLVYMEKYGRSPSDSVAIFDYCDRFEYGPQKFVKELYEKFGKSKKDA